MKKTLFIISLFTLFFSCGSASFQGFYNAHKTDLGATSFQVPNFMKALLSSVSVQTKSVIGNLQDLKYIQLEQVSEVRRASVISEMNAVTNYGFTDMFRKNEVAETRIISVKERGNILTDVIIFNSNNLKTTAFYLKGSFDPDKIKVLSEAKNFDAFSQDLLQSYKSNSNMTISPSFNPNN